MLEQRIAPAPETSVYSDRDPRTGDSGMPVSVIIVMSGAVLQAILAMLAIFLGLLAIGRPGIDGAKATHLDFALAASLWLWAFAHLILAHWTMFTVSGRHPTGWAVSFAFLFWGAAASCLLMLLVLIAALQAGPGVSELIFCSLLALTISTLAITFFRCHSWFGIRRRDAWGSLRRRGGWALILAAVVEMGPIILGALANR